MVKTLKILLIGTKITFKTDRWRRTSIGNISCVFIAMHFNAVDRRNTATPKQTKKRTYSFEPAQCFGQFVCIYGKY